MFATDEGELPLMDLRSLVFGSGAADGDGSAADGNG
jgi:hypothetical protein